MNKELERLGKKQLWTNQGTILEYAGGTEENHKKSQS
jgi:hypothetical protein